VALPDVSEDASRTAVWVRRGRHATTVTALGEFDLATATLLRDALTEACAFGGRVVVDLAGVTFVDASTLGLVVRAHGELAAHGSTIEIVNPSPTVIRLLRLTGLAWLTEVSE
jgi:anti-anti-sigma factor